MTLSSHHAQRPVALVTGGARRVGRATCLELARAGCDIIVTYRDSSADAQSLLTTLRDLGACASCVHLPLDDLSEVDAAARSIAASHSRCDVLVHNASVYEPAPLAAIEPNRALRDMTVNALAPLMLSRHLAPALTQSTLPGGGAIIAMADIHALGEHGIPRAGFASYAMSKAALVEMVRTLARELAPRVRANALALGVAAWPESGHESDAAAQQAYLSRVPLARPGTPDEVAKAVRWLALDAHSITGQVIRIDGGRSML
jgi:pteridine reductase